jgi:DNA mismatch repair ATPase MutS
MDAPNFGFSQASPGVQPMNNTPANPAVATQAPIANNNMQDYLKEVEDHPQLGKILRGSRPNPDEINNIIEGMKKIQAEQDAAKNNPQKKSTVNKQDKSHKEVNTDIKSKSDKPTQREIDQYERDSRRSSPNPSPTSIEDIVARQLRIKQ